jgi:hypothetical protein
MFFLGIGTPFSIISFYFIALFMLEENVDFLFLFESLFLILQQF